MLQTVRKEKVDEKLGSFASFPCFLSKLWSFNCPKKCIFPKSVKGIYIYASESSHYTLWENDMVYRGLSNRSWVIIDKNI